MKSHDPAAVKLTNVPIWPPIGGAILSIVVGAIVAYIGEKHRDIETHAIVILSIVAALLVFELGEIYHRYALAKELLLIRTSQEAIAGEQSNLRSIVRELSADRESSAIFASLRTSGWYETFKQVAQIIPTIDTAWGHDHFDSDLLNWKRREILSATVDNLLDLSDGNLVIDNPERELTTNIEFLRSLCRQRIRAVSFEDEGFWVSQAGLLFIEEHRRKLAEGRSIERIFIVDRSSKASLNHIFSTQMALGIAVRIAYKEDLAAKHPECIQDFVIYDDGHVRFGRRRSNTTTSLDKDCTLSKNQRLVSTFINYYDALHALSEPA